jgi:hypothetical protein
MPERQLDPGVTGFLNARALTRDEVFAEPSPVPSAPGAFGWWFRSLPGDMEQRQVASGCERRDDLTLLYVGSSPGPPPASGAKPVAQDLHKRIRFHFGGGGGDAQGSTLRKSLGLLLAKDLGLQLRRVGSGKRQTFAEGEAVLTQWMAENALVSWVIRPEPWLFEDTLVDTFDLPLNLNDKTRNPFFAELTRLRRDAAKRAAKMRVLAEW